MVTSGKPVTKRDQGPSGPGYIRLLRELDADEINDLERPDAGYLLKVDNHVEVDTIRVFDLSRWINSADCKNNRYPMRDEKQFQTLLDDMAEAGMLVKPVLDDASGQVVDGRHRLLALYQHRNEGIFYPFPGFEIRQFVDQVEIADFQDRYALQTRRLSRDQMGKLIQDAILRHPTWSDNKVANLLNCDGDTVGRHAEKLVTQGKLKRSEAGIGADGITRSRSRKGKTRDIPAPVALLLKSWLEEFGTYPVSPGNIATVMAPIGYVIPPDKKVTAKNSGQMIDEIAKHLKKLAGDRSSFGGYQVYVRAFGRGEIAFGLVAKKMRKPELELKQAMDSADAPSH